MRFFQLQSARSCFALTATSLWLAACGGQGSGSTPPGSGLATNQPPATPSTPSESTPQPGPSGEGRIDEGTPDPLVQTPPENAGTGNSTNPEPLAPPEPGTLNNGRFIGDKCVPVCASAATDPDATGATDGWGFENSESCVVLGGAPEGQGPACDRPDLLPPTPVQAEIPTGNQPRPPEVLSRGFFVANGRLFDRLGNDFVIRGVNHPVAWYQTDALAWMDDIAQTGSNAVRIVWETGQGTAPILSQAIARAIELKMVPMIELHDVTGSTDVAGPQNMAQFYVDSLKDTLVQYEDYLLVNICNEWGNFQTQDATWVQAYQAAITTLRNGGINHTLVIDGSNYGQNFRAILNQGQTLLDADPQHNVLFSTHMYQEFANPQSMMDALNGAVQRKLPFIVGEFGFQHGGPPPIAVPFQTMTAEAARLGIGYMAWSWTGNSGGVEYLDLVDRQSGAFTAWGSDIIDGANGIRATAKLAAAFAE
jgi:hypothetical protein